MTTPNPPPLLSTKNQHTGNLNSPVPYRKDINGLRAWAVLAVLLFHFKIPGMEAGFIGVDVFFVISGFLMTAIIAKGIEADNFSIKKFYAARARRILPALLVVITTLLILGWFFLPDVDYKALTKQSIYATGFVSNIFFWREAGYFETSSNERWLLHTWSLAVEAQFYILFPLFIMAIWKIKPKSKTISLGLIGLFISSLTLSIIASSWQPQAAFFLLPTRAWELAAGGLVFIFSRKLYLPKKVSTALFFTGCGLLVAAMLMLSKNYAWPSGWALFPVLGTALIIMSSQTKSWLTGNVVAQWLGDRSYSLYLWHWPLMVGLYFSGLDNSSAWTGIAIAVSLILAHLSFHFIEAPTHHYLVTKNLKTQSRILVLGALTAIIPATVILSTEQHNRIAPEIDLIASEASNRNQKAFECRYRLFNNSIPGCVFGEKTGDVILVGDSHSEAVASALEASAKNNNSGYIYYGGAHGCPTLNNLANVKTKCVNYNQLINEKINTLPTSIPLVIINSSWGELFSGDDLKNALTETVCSYTRSGRTVYLNRPIPSMPVHVANTMSRAMLFGKNIDPIKVSLTDYFNVNQKVWDAQDQAVAQCGAKVLDPLPYLCDSEYCYGSRDNRPLYFDSGHLSEHGNKFITPMFDKIFEEI
ncbi:acyltransferase family protein [Pseudomonas fragi]|uniref:acyltransferase family protein n=1 Tax=Pseudomonas fragi TaxID=296 RepID=UPI0030A1FCEA